MKNIEELKNRSWWNEEDDGNWDEETIEMVTCILGVDKDTVLDMVQFVFTLMENGGHSPYEFVKDFENIKKEFEEA